ncbi:Maf family protein [Alteromonas lipolytica]|uniref:dTTP/UTP pyrophosphatase n=1 Tax=Alteromonas lipolytica TaxID=1856405 RepID=A0A1E8F9J6_9ALTE|nr:Maf family protein [Alteromonas lipolytica]OFI32213.1 septum formation protein Maf [Alteromonas lipolytica]GGF82950.1 Maf-like protein [Alteromonas lipolytica]
MKQLRPLVLASASPRRAELLSQIGVKFTARPADIDESAKAGESAETLVQRLAAEKAIAAARLLKEQDTAVVLASDTVVVLDYKALGKPADKVDATSMLSALSNRSHQVMTAVSVLDGTQQTTLCVTTTVHFGPLSAARIDDYWATGEPADKAGSYGIQGIGGQFVKSIEGSYSAVVGLPLYETVQLLTEFGVIE